LTTAGTVAVADADAFIPRLYAVLGLALGLGYAMLVSPWQIPDEAQHFTRAYGISQGHCLAGPTVAVPRSIYLGNRFGDHAEVRDLARAGAPAAIRRLLRQPMVPRDSVGVAAANVDVYSCVAYLPAAAAIAVERAAGRSMLEAMYATRLAGLLVATLLTWLALRVLPTGRALMAAVALLPMTLHQAASASADSVSNAVAFLVVAAIVRLALDDTIVRIGRRTVAGLAVLLAVLALTKLNVFLCLPALAIPARKFGGTLRKGVMLTAGLVLCFGTFAIWQAINAAALARTSRLRAIAGIDYAGNVAFVVHQPLLVAVAIGNAFAAWWETYLAMFVGVLGLLAVPLPAWAWHLGLLAILLAALTAWPIRLSRPLAALFFGAAAISIVLLSVIEFASETTTQYRRHEILAGTGVAAGIQGRYYIPYAFALLAPFGLLAIPRRLRVLSLAAIAMVAFVSIPAYAALYDAFWRSPIVEPARAVEIGIERGSAWMLDTRRALVIEASSTRTIAAPLRGVVPYSRSGPHREIATYDAGRWRIGIAPGSLCTGRITWRQSFAFGAADDQPVFGDWWGTGTPSAGVFHDGVWSLRDPRHGHAQTRYRFGRPGDVAVTGDWNGDGRAKLGVFRKGLWLLDVSGLRQHGLDLPGSVRVYALGDETARPVVGDWNGDGHDKIGVVEGRQWILDVNGDGNRRTPSHDAGGFPFGTRGDVPLVGRWGC
jgi:uncharacterized membrane protein